MVTSAGILVLSETKAPARCACSSLVNTAAAVKVCRQLCLAKENEQAVASQAGEKVGKATGC